MIMIVRVFPLLSAVALSLDLRDSEWLGCSR